MTQANAGDWRTPTLTVSPADGTTVATLRIRKGDGTYVTPDPTPTGSGGGASWSAPKYQLTVAGRWAEIWTVVNTGAGKESVEFDVLAVPPVPDDTATGTYAPTQNSADLIGGDLPSNIRPLLLGRSPPNRSA